MTEDELVPSDDRYEAAARAVRAAHLLARELPVVAHERERLAPADAKLLLAAEGQQLRHARRRRCAALGRRHRVGRGAAAARERVHGAGRCPADGCALKLLEQVDHNLQVARNDEHLHVLVDVQALLAQLRQQQVPIVELGDGRARLLERIELGIAHAQLLQQPCHACPVDKLLRRLPAQHVAVERRRVELGVVEEAELEKPLADGGGQDEGRGHRRG